MGFKVCAKDLYHLVNLFKAASTLFSCVITLELPYNLRPVARINDFYFLHYCKLSKKCIVVFSEALKTVNI